MRPILVILLAFTLSQAGFSATLHVPGDHSTLQGAIDAAQPGDLVLVAPGTYIENIDFHGKALTLKSEDGPYSTIIDGNSAWCVATMVSGEGPDTVLDGFTLTNGLGGGYPIYIGGGITVKNASPTIINNRIMNNIAGGQWGGGGGLYVSNASPEIRNNDIIGNWAGYNCGGIFCLDNSNPIISGNNISWNTGYVAGGIYCQYASSPLIENNLIHENVATNGCEGWGAGIFCYWDSCPTIRKNVISNNLGHKPGAGICCIDNADALIIQNIITGNISTKSAGGFMAERASPTLKRNLIYGNTCTKFGGGIGVSFGAPEIVNNIIANNTANGPFGGFGGGIWLDYASPAITNNTLYGNMAASEGGAVWCVHADVDLANNVLWGNSAPKGKEICLTDSSILDIRSCDVEGGQASAFVFPGSSLSWGSGMIDLDPKFVDPANGDLHILYTSPCRNMGDNTAPAPGSLDFDGNPRVAYSQVDMGADEFYPHLYYTGAASPGGAVRAVLTGKPGTTQVGLWLSAGVLPTPVQSMFGPWHLAPPYIGPFIFGAFPASGVHLLSAKLPMSPPAPYDIPMQALIGNELTGLCVITVR